MGTTYKLQSNVKLTRMGRRDIPPVEGNYGKFKFPVAKMKVGQSFVACEEYNYGKTISIKHKCRRLAKNAGIEMSFAVREWKGKIRVWRVK